MATIADLWVTLGLKSDGFSKGIRSAENDLDSFASKAAAAGAKMASIGKGMTLAISAPIAAGVLFAVNAASDLEEAQSAAVATYGDMADQVIKASKGAADSVFLSQADYLQAATVLGVYGQGAGLAGDALVSFGGDAITAAADLASFYNVPLDVALAAWKSGLSGETEPMRQFGIFMNEAELQAFALTEGIWDGSAAMTEQQKILARQNFMLSEMGPAQGDAARTAGSLANVQRKLAAQFENVAQTIGKHLLPAALKLTTFIGKLFTKFESFSPALVKFGVLFAVAAAAIGPLLIVLGYLFQALAPIGVVLGLLLSPIGLVIAAIGLLAFAFRGPIFSAIGEVIGRIREFISDITKVYDRLREAKNILDPTTRQWIQMGSGVSVASALIRAFGSALEDLTGIEMSGFFFNLADAVDIFMSSFSAFRDLDMNVIESAWRALGDALTTFTGVDASAWFNDVAVAVGALWSAITSADISAAISALGDLVELTLEPVAVNVVEWVKGTAWPSLRDFVTETATAAWGVISAFAVPLGNVLVDIAAWAKGTAWPSLRDFVVETATAAAGIIAGFAVPIGNVLVDIAGWAKGTAWPSLRDFVVSTATAAAGVIAGFAVPIGNVIVDIAGWAKGVWPSLREFVVNAATAAAGVIAEFAVEIGDVLVDIAGWAKGTAWPSLREFVVDTATSAAGVIAGFAVPIGEVLVDIAGWAKGEWPSLREFIVTKTLEGWEIIKGYAVDLPEVLVNIAKVTAEAAEGAYSTVQPTIQAGVQAAIAAEPIEVSPEIRISTEEKSHTFTLQVAVWAAGLFANMRDIVGGIPWGGIWGGIKLGSQILDAFITTLMNLPLGIAAWISLIFGPAILTFIGDAFRGIMRAVGELWNGLGLPTLSNPFEGLGYKIQSWILDIQQFFTGGAGFGGTRGDEGSGGGFSFSGMLTDFIQPLLDWEMPSIPNPFSGLGGTIQGWIDNIPMPSVPEWLKKMASGDIMGAIGAMISSGNEGWGMSAPVTPPGYGPPGGQVQPGTDLNLGDPSVEPVGKAFVVPAPDFSKFLTAHDTAFADAGSKFDTFATDATNKGLAAAQGFTNTFDLNPAVAHAGAVQGSLDSIFSGIATNATNMGMVAGQGFNSGIVAGTSQAVAAAGSAAGALSGIFSGIAASMTNLGVAGGQGFAFGVSSGMSQAVGAAYAGAGAIRGALSGIGNMYGEGYSIGNSLGQGIAAGIAGMVGAVAAQAAGIVNAAVNAARGAGAIRSPSKVMAEMVGKPLAQGVALGIRQGIRDVDRAALGLVPSVRPNTVPGLSDYSAGAGTGGIHVSLTVQGDVYDGDGFEDRVVNVVVDKVVPAVAEAARQRDRAIGVRR